MSDDVRRSDWELLGLEPGASPAAVYEAYEMRRRLYSAESLATYTLLTESERAAHVERLKGAMERITKTGPAVTAATAPRSSTPLPDAQLGDCPDLHRSPGGFLRHHRLLRGVSLEEIAKETRISRVHLENLENERFDNLPAAVYVRGFATQYARALSLGEHETLAARFAELLSESPSED